jgi:hypothetical protein
VKFGRKRPSVRHRLRLENYSLDLRALPVPPETTDYEKQAAAALSQLYDNDTLGDCVIAGGYHLLGVRTGNSTGTPFVAADAQIVGDYTAIGGYQPGIPSTDQGCDETVALNYWSQHGYANGDKLAGFVTVDATNVQLVKAASFLFEGLFLGVELPDAWVANEPSSSGFTWDVAGDPDPSNGHCVVGVDYSDAGLLISTWGMTGTMTFEALAKYAVPSANGELYALISQDAIEAGKQIAPNGLDWAMLEADFKTMGGTLP